MLKDTNKASQNASAFNECFWNGLISIARNVSIIKEEILKLKGQFERRGCSKNCRYKKQLKNLTNIPQTPKQT